MIAEKCRRFLSGTVAFTASGGFPSLFLEECALRNTALYDVRVTEGSLAAATAERDYRNAEAAAEKAGMTIAAQSVSGLPLLLRRCRARAGILLGLLLGALLVWYLSGSLWEVTVTGNETIGAEEILDALAELGVQRGARIARLDLPEAERQVTALLPKLAWISVNLSGCRAEAEVREITEASLPPPEGEYANIVAARDGVIVRADVFSGSGQPKIGEAVVKGDLLVSGVVEMNGGAYRLTEAKAAVEALTKTEIAVSCPNSFAAQVPVERRNVYRLCCFGCRIQLGAAPEGSETQESGRFLRSRRMTLPIGVVRESAAVFTEQTVTTDGDRAALLCFASFCEQAEERYRQARVLRRSIAFSPEKDGCSLRAEYECVEEIGSRVPLTVEPGR